MKYLASAVFVGLLSAQAPNQSPSVNPAPTTNPNQPVQLETTPVFRVNVVSRTAKAVNYRHRSGATKVDFRGTELMPKARGEAKVESKKGYIEIEVEFDDLTPATQYGPEYLTYVMWAISPEGRATNLGEILLDGAGRGKLNVTTELQAFGLVVTAEPYFAVAQPSDVVVIENVIRPDTQGRVEVIDASYDLLKRGSYVFNVSESRLPVSPQVGSGAPLYLYEARNAIQIARWAGADRYAADAFRKAEGLLRQAEDYHTRRQEKPTAMVAREAVQTAEDARLIAVERKEQERLANERRAAAEREAAERANAEASARAKAQAEQTAQLEAQRRAQAEAERLAAEKAKAEADAARQAAQVEQQALARQAEQARRAAEDAERARTAAESDRQRMREQLRQQLNLILETRESARGLIVNMSDVLFDTGRYTLKPGAREKLAKISGILLAHPGLKIEIEGHTDSVGGDEYNQRLSEQRAASVRDYLTSQGISPAIVSALGFGEERPVASNDNAAGRQRNRRVELVVSGGVIGTQASDAAISSPGPRE
jgi:outer membrane protein OmpA-like peptidoglycan-associated protein